MSRLNVTFVAPLLIRGDMQIWERRSLRMINLLQAPDSTQFEWCADSRHIVTATTAPRLKVDNGYKIWHYSRGLQHKVDVKELWGVRWQPVPRNALAVRPTSPVTAQAKAAAPVKAAAYRPPGARGQASTIKLHEPDPVPVAEELPVTKAALKNKKKRERAKVQADAAPADANPFSRQTAEQCDAVAMAKIILQETPVEEAAGGGSSSSSELDKKLRNLTKKLRQIEQLKEKEAHGEFLQANQLEKIAAETTLRKEIEQVETQMKDMGL